MKNKHPVLLGAHMSIAGGIENAFYSGASIGCNAIQIFTHSNRQWAMKDLTPSTIEATKKAQKETGINHVLVHASYLINLGSESAGTVKLSINTLKKELAHCLALGIPYLVLHPGGNSDQRKAMDQISEGLNEVLESVDTPSKNGPIILLETMAGQGSQVGYQFDQLASIKSNIHDKKRIAFCIDTCHLWAAGYDFSSEKEYDAVLKEFDTVLGISSLKAIHVNDSKQQLGSRVDRHEDIGKGTIGLKAFSLLMNDDRLQSVAKILETPRTELDDYLRNMKTLISLIEQQ